MKASPSITFAGLKTGIASLGTSFQAARGETNEFTPGQYTGLYKYYDLEYNDKLGYFTYPSLQTHNILHWTG